jgi:hypothetical protein
MCVLMLLNVWLSKVRRLLLYVASYYCVSPRTTVCVFVLVYMPAQYYYICANIPVARAEPLASNSNVT